MRCDSCGKFFPADEPGSSHCFVPDSDLSSEEIADRCFPCTKKQGVVTSNQNVLPKFTSWVSL